MSVFPDGTLEVENPQSREEDEELEEQRRRQEELTDLLAAGIHAFNYDESTMNSSATSFEGPEHGKDFHCDGSSKTNLDTAEQDYRDANHQDQLKVLYEVRMREISNLKKEFVQYREEKEKEINILKHKVTLSEAEICHLQLSLSNLESLLVEKTELIKNFKLNGAAKDQEIEKLKRTIDELKLEICTYNASVNELQLKLSDNHPLSAGDRKFKSEELQKAHRAQIIKLETLGQEQSKKTQILEKENDRLKDDLKKLLKSKKEMEEENNFTIMSLSKKLQSSQQQCKDLYLLGEAIKKESDHFKERLQQMEAQKVIASGDSFKIKQTDKETLMVHMEKLKRMLLDKDIEMNTLKSKLKFYASDMDELLEYRKIYNEMYNCEIKSCSNSEHEELLIFMQRQLQSYQQAVEDRNNQILSLTMVNKELREKIEEMIKQTRTDIQNLSQKYSLPQLETMSNELKSAEKTINDLRKRLEELTSQLEEAQNRNENEKQAFEATLQKRGEENLRLQQSVEELRGENDALKSEMAQVSAKLGFPPSDLLKFEDHDLDALRSKCGQVHDQLQQVASHLEKMTLKDYNLSVILKLRKQISNYLNVLRGDDFEKAQIEEKLRHWIGVLSDFIDGLRGTESTTNELRDSVEDLTNCNTMLEGEKFALEYQLKSCNAELENARQEIKDLIESRESNARMIHKLRERVANLEEALKMSEEAKTGIERQLEEARKQVNEANQETIRLHRELNEESENAVRQNLFKELRDVEGVLERSKTEGGDTDFQKYIQAEVLKAELVLRERLEEENVKKMGKIEERYRDVLTQRTEIYEKEKEKWKNQEARYRKQFATILEECGKKIEELEIENANLIKQINELIRDYKNYKVSAANDAEHCKKIIDDCKKNMDVLNKNWQDLFRYYILNFMNIEKKNQKKITKLQKTMVMNQTEINLITSMYDEKVKKFKSEWKATHRC